MSEPGFDQFAQLAADYSVVPVWRELLGDSITPVGAFRNVVGDGDGFLFESAEHGGRFGRYSFLGRAPAATIVSRGQKLEIASGGLPRTVELGDGILACMEELLDKFASPVLEGLPPMHGGVVGYLGYDVVREVENLGQPRPDDREIPDAVMSVIGEMAAFDHWRSRVVIIDNVLLPSGEFDLKQSGSGGVLSENWLRAAYTTAEDHLEGLRRDLEKPTIGSLIEPPDRTAKLPDSLVKRVVSSQRYQEAVIAAKEYIRAGDAFQVVLSQRFDLDLDVDPFDVYRVLRQVNPSPYMFFLRQGGVSVVGASPEPMVQLLGGRVISRPIAGTRRRGATEEEDRRLGAELAEDSKELAEHVMLVDLARNDVGRVVKFGTEQVDELMTLERYSHVMHMTSQVSGELVEGKGPIDVLRATLPAGTVSGAPKVRAMEIIDELETTKRGPYAGVVGYLDFSGNLDTAIAIRTLVVGPDGRASVQAGAGIVADSDPSAEDSECLAKAQAILSAVAGAQKMAADHKCNPAPLPESVISDTGKSIGQTPAT